MCHEKDARSVDDCLACPVMLAVAGCSSSASSPTSSSPSPTVSGTRQHASTHTHHQIRKHHRESRGLPQRNDAVNVTRVLDQQCEGSDVSQPHSDGSAQFNGGAKVVGPERPPSVYGGITNLEMYSVTVTATNQKPGFEVRPPVTTRSRGGTVSNRPRKPGYRGYLPLAPHGWTGRNDSND